MATKPDAEAPPTAMPAPLPEVQPTMTVEDYAARASATERRVELLTAFAREEAAAGRVHDTEAAFAARFAAFADRPVA